MKITSSNWFITHFVVPFRNVENPQRTQLACLLFGSTVMSIIFNIYGISTYPTVMEWVELDHLLWTLRAKFEYENLSPVATKEFTFWYTYHSAMGAYFLFFLTTLSLWIAWHAKERNVPNDHADDKLPKDRKNLFYFYLGGLIFGLLMPFFLPTPFHGTEVTRAILPISVYTVFWLSALHYLAFSIIAGYLIDLKFFFKSNPKQQKEEK